MNGERQYPVWMQVPAERMQMEVIDRESMLYLVFRRPQGYCEPAAAWPEYPYKVEASRWYDGFWRVFVPSVAEGERIAAGWYAEDLYVLQRMVVRSREELQWSDAEYERAYSRYLEFWGPGWWRIHLRRRVEVYSCYVPERGEVLSRAEHPYRPDRVAGMGDGDILEVAAAEAPA